MQQQAKTVYTGGMWNRAIAVQHVLCSDGVRRYARLTSDPDTFFTCPACVQVKGKTVSGFVSSHTRKDGIEDQCFIAYAYGKNGNLLPGIVESEY